MADSTLASLTATSALSGEDLYYAVRDPSGTPVDRKATHLLLARELGLGIDNRWIFEEEFGAASADDYEFNANTSSLPSGWSWVNQGSATYDEHGGVGMLTATVQSGDQLRMLVRSQTASSFDIKMKLTGTVGPTNYQGIGMVLRDSSSGKLYTLSTKNNDGNASINYFSSATTYGSSVSGTTFPSYPFRYNYLRVRKNSATSWDFFFSEDGASWWPVLLGHNPSGTLTIDQVGFFANANGGDSGKPPVAACHWYRVR